MGANAHLNKYVIFEDGVMRISHNWPSARYCDDSDMVYSPHNQSWWCVDEGWILVEDKTTVPKEYRMRVLLLP